MYLVRLLTRTGIAGVVLAAAVLFCFCTLMGLLVSAVIITEPDVWYFPGDPPWAELGILAARTSLIAILAGVAGLAGLGWSRRRHVRLACLAAAGTWVLVAALPALVIANRHFGEWSTFRATVLREVATARDAGAKSRSFEQGLVFRFSTRKLPVRIRSVTTGPRPRMWADFGEGGNAVLDLRTMWCVFSD
jgi:hypothetical protein